MAALIIVASRHDPCAATLVARWSAHGATLLTAADLSTAGWRQFQGCAGDSTAVASGKVLKEEEIAGVLIRWPGVFEPELDRIEPADRAYVVAEMNAFLTYWTTRLACPVLNRPTAASLLAPGWRPEQWVQAARRLGLRCQPMRRRVAFSEPRESASPERGEPGSHMVTVVGERCLGAVDPELAVHARRLADAAAVDLLQVHFSAPEPGASFLGVSLLPDLAADGVADAVLSFFLDRGAGR
jgi:hypothetical protein